MQTGSGTKSGGSIGIQGTKEKAGISVKLPWSSVPTGSEQSCMQGGLRCSFFGKPPPHPVLSRCGKLCPDTPYLGLAPGWNGGGCVSVTVTRILGQSGVFPSSWRNLKGKVRASDLGNKASLSKERWFLRGVAVTLQSRSAPGECCLLFTSRVCQPRLRVAGRLAFLSMSEVLHS